VWSQKSKGKADKLAEVSISRKNIKKKLGGRWTTRRGCPKKPNSCPRETDRQKTLPSVRGDAREKRRGGARGWGTWRAGNRTALAGTNFADKAATRSVSTIKNRTKTRVTGKTGIKRGKFWAEEDGQTAKEKHWNKSHKKKRTSSVRRFGEKRSSKKEKQAPKR